MFQGKRKDVVFERLFRPHPLRSAEGLVGSRHAGVCPGAGVVGNLSIVKIAIAISLYNPMAESAYLVGNGCTETRHGRQRYGFDVRRVGNANRVAIRIENVGYLVEKRLAGECFLTLG